MKQPQFLSIILFGIAAVYGTGRAGARTQQNTDGSSEYSTYQAAHNEKDAQARIKLLDKFTAQYPDSPLIPDAYQDYYEAYFSTGSYPQAIEYADRLVALGDKVDVNVRVVAVMTREVAYSVYCSQPELRTQDAYARARDAGKQGLELIGRWHKPENLSDEQFDAENKSFRIILSQVEEMGEAGLAGRIVSCPSRPPDPGNFNRMIHDIQQQEEQSPNVR